MNLQASNLLVLELTEIFERELDLNIWESDTSEGYQIKTRHIEHGFFLMGP